MGVKKLNIRIENGLFNSFRPGQCIIGKVILNLDSPCKSKGLFVRFYGAASGNWTQQSGNTKYIYRIREPYFDGGVYLFGGKSSEEIQLPAGENFYPFAFKLPAQLPPSFHEGGAKVEYFIESRLHRSWRSDNTAKQPFFVNTVLDLRPFLSLPLANHEEGTVCCCCCASGPVKVSLVINKGGYVPRELITFNASVLNKSKSQLKAYYSLKQIIDMRARGGHYTNTNVILRNKLGDVPAGETRQWKQDVSVPDVPPTGLPNCILIKVKYHFSISARTFGGYFEAPCEIIIGTIPNEGILPPNTRSARSAPRPRAEATGSSNPINQSKFQHEYIHLSNNPRSNTPSSQQDRSGTAATQDGTADAIAEDRPASIWEIRPQLVRGAIPLKYVPLESETTHQSAQVRSEQPLHTGQVDIESASVQSSPSACSDPQKQTGDEEDSIMVQAENLNETDKTKLI